MILSTKKHFSDCLSINENYQFIGHYQGLTLSSVYQPIFDIANKVIGIEALVRILDSQGQFIRPDLFFQSEEVSYSDKLNVERLSRVIHIRNFSQSVYCKHKLFLNVLPSASRHLAVEDLKNGLLARRLKALNIHSSQIVMEIVEMTADNEASLKLAIHRLNQYGFNIAIDDYGVDASNRERVETLQPNIIKMDRSLLLQYMDGSENALVSGIELAKRVGAKVVVEGIETQEQHLAMQALNVDMYQGYFLAVPEAIYPTSIERTG
ncbi:diguanylate phosphodiesterase [Vibrio coralliilyticus]|uniref:EAL domain-containing protein n=1 Tax=Vibrio coralliilyticus TaxID=190893 RepID=UPI0008103979|nr:EAL domain-containing protein [Vibrio coralliilyticus]ANW25765.1 diguanylate phosphodiesterase [Vibrio coralliilyticus]